MIRLLNIILLILSTVALYAQPNQFQMPPIETHFTGQTLVDVLYPSSSSSTLTITTLSTQLDDFWPQNNPSWQNGYDIKNSKGRIKLEIITQDNEADFSFKCVVPYTADIYKEDYSQQTVSGSIEVYYDHRVGTSYQQIDMVEYEHTYKMKQ